MHVHVKKNVAVLLSSKSCVVVFLVCLSQFSACRSNSFEASNRDVTPIIANPKTEGVVWLSIDTKEKSLTVLNGQRPLHVFSQVALGGAGAGIKKKRGDSITPLGSFRIGWITPSARFRWFIGLNYPTVEYAQRALDAGLIDDKTFSGIQEAFRNKATPPQTTALGGYIGIHGLGRGSLDTHHLLNWTSGCVALDNEQIKALVKIVQPQMLVEIK